jgi:hypothetical protein
MMAVAWVGASLQVALGQRRRRGQRVQDAFPGLQFVLDQQRERAHRLGDAVFLGAPLFHVDVADRQCCRRERGHQDGEDDDQESGSDAHRGKSAAACGGRRDAEILPDK